MPGHALGTKPSLMLVIPNAEDLKRVPRGRRVRLKTVSLSRVSPCREKVQGECVEMEKWGRVLEKGQGGGPKKWVNLRNRMKHFFVGKGTRGAVVIQRINQKPHKCHSLYL